MGASEGATKQKPICEVSVSTKEIPLPLILASGLSVWDVRRGGLDATSYGVAVFDFRLLRARGETKVSARV